MRAGSRAGWRSRCTTTRAVAPNAVVNPINVADGNHNTVKPADAVPDAVTIPHTGTDAGAVGCV